MKFRTVEHAVKWAAETMARNGVAISRYSESIPGAGRALSINEQHAQAVWIIGHVMQLPAREFLVIAGKLAFPISEREAIAKDLGSMVAHYAPREGVDHERAAFWVARWLDDRETGGSVEYAKTFCVHRNTAAHHRAAVYDVLSEWYETGVAALELLMRDMLSNARYACHAAAA